MFRLFTALLILASVEVVGQESFKTRPSPLAVTTVRYKDSYLKIVYGQPQKRGRVIFGSLVPFGQVWRTGANEATELTTTRDIRINGLELKSGTYTLFTIPDKETWKIILNSDLGLWGSYNYNPKMDVMTFDVPVAYLGDLTYEALTIWFEPHLDKADLNIAWDHTKVTIPIQFTEPKQ